MADKCFFQLDNTIQNYNWGSKDQLTKLLGIANEKNLPLAEIWMGAHDKAPSKIIDGRKKIALNQYISNQPNQILSSEAASIYNGKLPFLFKVLSAGNPLSIQAHPDKETAETGYQRENDLKIPIQAPDRNYKDPNHKPELICALTEFKALNGFRPIQEIIDHFKWIEFPTLASKLDTLEEHPNDTQLKQFYAKLMQLPASEKIDLIKSFYAVAAPKEDSASREFMRLVDTAPADIGVLSPFLLNLIILRPGEAMYLPAGELHAYLYGTCIEIMANSDNVIRGGLTSKHVDIDELIRILTFKGRRPEILKPEGPTISVIKEYNTDAREFLLSVIELTEENQTVFISTNSIEILICTKGQIKLKQSEKGQDLDLVRADSCVIPASTGNYQIEGKGVIYRASVPIR